MEVRAVRAVAALDMRAAERVHARAARGSLAQVTNSVLKKMIVSVTLQEVPFKRGGALLPRSHHVRVQLGAWHEKLSACSTLAISRSSSSTVAG